MVGAAEAIGDLRWDFPRHYITAGEAVKAFPEAGVEIRLWWENSNRCRAATIPRVTRIQKIIEEFQFQFEAHVSHGLFLV